MSADVLYMSDHDNDGPSQQDTGAPPPRKREKRKPRVDAGDVDRLVRDYALQEGTDLAWCRSKRKPSKIAHLRLQYGNDAVRMWLASPKRLLIGETQIVFDPSEKCPKHFVNLFEPCEIEAKEGDCGPFFEVLTHMCEGDSAAITYMLNWCAYPLQNPGHKLKTALVVHGDEGTGKNFLFEAVAALHGKHGKIVGQRELESQWNEWASACTFLIGDEVVSRTEMRHHKGVLKALITSEKINIATKFLNLRAETNRMNLVFLSNETQPLVLDPSDRRYFVLWTAPRGAADMYERFVRWRENGGLSALLYMLKTRDLSDWDWWAPPPMTEAKRDLIELGRLSPERFVLNWRAGDVTGLPWQACSSDQAFRAYRSWCGAEGERWPMSKPQFTRLSRRAVPDLRVVVARQTDGTTLRMWCPTEPKLHDGATMTTWCTDTVQVFESVLKRWVFSRFPEREGSQ